MPESNRHTSTDHIGRSIFMSNDNTGDRDAGADRVTGRQPGRATDILDPNNQIGVKLRSLYAAVQEEVIPDRLLSLLEQLDQAERKSSVVPGQINGGKISE